LADNAQTEGLKLISEWCKWLVAVQSAGIGLIATLVKGDGRPICKKCQKSFELVLTLGEHDKNNITCPKCGSKNVERDAAVFFAVTSKKS